MVHPSLLELGLLSLFLQLDKMLCMHGIRLVLFSVKKMKPLMIGYRVFATYWNMSACLLWLSLTPKMANIVLEYVVMAHGLIPISFVGYIYLKTLRTYTQADIVYHKSLKQSYRIIKH